MKKFYRLLSFIFIGLIILAGLALAIFPQDIFSYLNYANDVSGQPADLSQEKIGIKTSGAKESFNLELLDSPKFKRLRQTEVDLSGLDIPESLRKQAGTSTSTSDQPTFKVGNPNPFRGSN